MGLIETLVEFIQNGGKFMFPILFVGAIGAGIAIERFITLSLVRVKNRSMWNRLEPVISEGDFATAREMTSDNDSTVSQMLALGLARQGSVRRREDIEIAMEEGMMEIIPQLEKRTGYIALFANIATLLGLLGTIMGLISAFNAVANANPAEKADLLSASISVAMNTTAFGLMVAIPLLVIHAYLNSRTGEIVDSLEMASVKTLNVISGTAPRKYQASTAKAEPAPAAAG
ncbi:MotA/TolQ/ExbB proton channel family protein [Thiohalomonas denitrificans]|uniref:Outer membrane transport energization protein ExbB n=1 Tax=Thiohalomonas denitrificans TaxID=415747 RepID=A0A1G5QTT2_9GAMM|nr:MotA/TolQ/ExbB proton channel family protein [Thiohalomonas denitrificans]SCZ64631.1 outer membrane transport energization protein ExbB [Thiohalomonas denitrificans]